MHRRMFIGLAAALLALPATAAFASNHTAEVVVVHGVPGLDVDVLVNGEAAIEDFSFADDPVVTQLDAGRYTLAVAAPGSTEAILELDANLTAGSSVTVAAYLDTNGDPQLRAFANETGATGIQPFHLANFGAVDILAGDTAVLEGVTNGQTARIDLDGGTTVDDVGIGAAGSGTAAIELGNVTVPADTLVLAYAIGPDAGDDLPTVVVATVGVSAHADQIPSGTGGTAGALPAGVLVAMLIGMALIAAPAVATARRRNG